MLLGHKVGRRLVTATPVVDVDVVRAGEIDVGGDQNGRDSRNRVGENVILRQAQAGNRDDETLDTALEHEPEIGALVVLRAFLDATDDEEVAALPCLGLSAGDRLGEEVVADVGRDHTQGVGTAG